MMGDTPVMPGPPTTDVPTTKVQPGVLVLATLFISSAAGVAFFWVGDLSEAIEPRDADYLWRPWVLLSEYETLIGVASVIVFLVTCTALVAARRNGRVPPPLLAQIVVLTLLTAWLGLGYRVMTAGVIGANIGGGGVMLLTPIVALVSVASVAVLAIRASRRAGRII